MRAIRLLLPLLMLSVDGPAEPSGHGPAHYVRRHVDLSLDVALARQEIGRREVRLQHHREWWRPTSHLLAESRREIVDNTRWQETRTREVGLALDWETRLGTDIRLEAGRRHREVRTEASPLVMPTPDETRTQWEMTVEQPLLHGWTPTHNRRPLVAARADHRRAELALALAQRNAARTALERMIALGFARERLALERQEVRRLGRQLKHLVRRLHAGQAAQKAVRLTRERLRQQQDTRADWQMQVNTAVQDLTRDWPAAKARVFPTGNRDWPTLATLDRILGAAVAGLDEEDVARPGIRQARAAVRAARHRYRYHEDAQSPQLSGFLELQSEIPDNGTRSTRQVAGLRLTFPLYEPETHRAQVDRRIALDDALAELAVRRQKDYADFETLQKRIELARRLRSGQTRMVSWQQEQWKDQRARYRDHTTSAENLLSAQRTLLEENRLLQERVRDLVLLYARQVTGGLPEFEQWLTGFHLEVQRENWETR